MNISLVDSIIIELSISKLDLELTEAQENLFRGPQDEELKARVEALEAKTHTSDFTNDGDGTSPFATLEDVEEQGGKINTITFNGQNVPIDENKNAAITAGASDVGALPSSTKYGANLSLSGTNLQLKDQDGNNLGSPISIQDTDTGATSVETVGAGNAVTTASYDAATRKMTLTKGETFALATDSGYYIQLNLNTTDYKVTATLKDKDGATISTSNAIDLPIESVVVGGAYDSGTKEVVLTLQGGSTIRFSVADLVSGLQSEITSANKLASDLVDDTTSANKFVTATEKGVWNGKQDAISDLATIRSGASAGATAVQPSDLGALASKDTVDYVTEVTNKPTIPTVNNATLTIQKNGQTVATFTANSATDVTANIEADTQEQADWNQTNTSAPDYIKNKPTKVSDFQNDSGFITNAVDDLANYYLKSETYTKAEVVSLISGLKTINAEFVDTLPTASADTYFNDSKTIYFLRNESTSGNNYYDEYVTIRSGAEGSYVYSWEYIGSTEIHLEAISNAEIDAMF